MKLDSYIIMEAIRAGDAVTAANILLQHFDVPLPEDLPHISVRTALVEEKIMVWDGDSYYEWCDSTGFDHGMHSYTRNGARSDQIRNIIVWTRAHD